MEKLICVSTRSSVGLVTIVEVPSQVDQMFLHSDEGRVFLHSGVGTRLLLSIANLMGEVNRVFFYSRPGPCYR